MFDHICACYFLCEMLMQIMSYCFNSIPTNFICLNGVFKTTLHVFLIVIEVHAFMFIVIRLLNDNCVCT